ncbi:MAG: DUF58 domain-containing protein [Actinobacteria bacterium]|nr:DUF58 domain-containing protein [Actinomycetota bacterium]
MSKRAVTLILVAIALCLIAATIRSGWLYLVSSALISLVVVGLFAGRWATRRVEVERDCPTEVFEGEPFSVRLRVRNSGMVSRNLISVQDRQFAGSRGRAGFMAELQRRRDESREKLNSARAGEAGGRTADSDEGAPARYCPTVTFESVPPGCDVETPYLMTAPRRGIYDAADLSVSCGGIFGVTEVKRAVKVPSSITVLPRVYRLEEFPFNPQASTSPVESREWSRKGIGENYYGIREYTHGDPLRHIHWKSTARHGDLIVKEYQEEFRPSAGLVVLLCEPAYGSVDVNSLEDGLRAAASIVNYFVEMGSTPQLVVPRNGTFEVVETVSMKDSLKVLAEYSPPEDKTGAGGRLHEALSIAQHQLSPGCALGVVTNIDPADIADVLTSWWGWQELSVVLALDESYGLAFPKRASGRLAELELVSGGQLVDVFLVRKGREIPECLSAPLSTTDL